MSSPKISIVIPVYNVEQYLSECLNSILAQSYRYFEVIIIDDGSPDNSGIICDAYAEKDSRIHVLHQKNSGVSVARNNGIRLSQGEWITFIDSDDWVDENYLESFNLFAECELSIQGHKTFKNVGQSIIEVRDFEEVEISLSKDYKSIAKNNLLSYGTICSKAYRKDIIKKYKINFKESISYHEDHIFFLQYLQHINNVSLHESVGYNYRITNNASSLSRKTHSWIKLNDSGNMMFGELLLLPFFKCLSNSYKKEMTTYCLLPKISACRVLFMSKNGSDSEKNKDFKIIINDIKVIRQYYCPIELKNKILKICLIGGYLPTKIYYRISRFLKTFRR